MPRARCALAMTPHKGGRYKPGGSSRRPTPTDGLLVVPCRECEKKPGRADVGIGPYGSATRGAMGGRPQGSPLRKRYKGCGEAAGWGQPTLRGVIRGAVKRADVGIGPYGWVQGVWCKTGRRVNPLLRKTLPGRPELPFCLGAAEYCPVRRR